MGSFLIGWPLCISLTLRPSSESHPLNCPSSVARPGKTYTALARGIYCLRKISRCMGSHLTECIRSWQHHRETMPAYVGFLTTPFLIKRTKSSSLLSWAILTNWSSDWPSKSMTKIGTKSTLWNGTTGWASTLLVICPLGNPSNVSKLRHITLGLKLYLATSKEYAWWEPATASSYLDTYYHSWSRNTSLAWLMTTGRLQLQMLNAV